MPEKLITTTKIGAKEKIIQILSENPNLTAKQIHHKLSRQYASTNTYQYTHKTLKQMLNETIIQKQKTQYKLNPVWVENYKKNAEQLSEKIKINSKEIKLEDLKEGETIQLTFKGILELGWFLVDKLMQAPNPKKKPCLALWRFCYSIVGLEEKHLNGLKSGFKKNNWHLLIEEKNKVDKMFGKTMLTYGAKEVKYGIKCATNLSDKIIIGNLIIEITYTSAFRKLWELQSRFPIKIVEFNLGKHIILMREFQPKIQLTITRNSDLAEEYRREYLKKC